MTITAYTMLEARTSGALNTLVAAAIVAGKQPYGPPILRDDGSVQWFCQAVISGAQILVGDTGAAAAEPTGTGFQHSTDGATDAAAMEVADVKTALSLGSAAYTASTAYATSAQGTKADSALQSFGAGTVRAAEGVPSGTPTGVESRIAFDSTAVTGGVYYWSGSAWVKMATIAA